VAIDLNAVPPLGIEGVEASDKAAERDRLVCYGAIGVGGTKMKVHKAAVARLFESNDQGLDAEEGYALAQRFLGPPANPPPRPAAPPAPAASTSSCWKTARLPTRAASPPSS